MLTENLLPANVPINTLRRIMSDAFQIDPSALQTLREADGDTFAPELDAHGPGLCIRPRCRRVACVALKNDILVRHGYEKVPA